MKLVAVQNLILQFDLDCETEDLEVEIKEFIGKVNFALPRLFKEEAPQLLNVDSKLHIIVEDFD